MFTAYEMLSLMCICLKAVTEGKRKNLSSTVSVPKWPQQPGLSQAQPVASSWSPMWIQGHKNCSYPPVLSKAHKPGTAMEVEQLKFKSLLIWNT